MWSGITSDSKKHVITDSEMTPLSGERNFQDLKTAEPKGQKEKNTYSKRHVNDKIASQVTWANCLHKTCKDLCENEIKNSNDLSRLAYRFEWLLKLI